MQVVDLNGSVTKWQLVGNIAHGKVKNKSSLHLEARSLINNTFPTLQVLEEVAIHIRRSEVLYLDFYLPLTKKCIEVHGEQHYQYSSFFHQSRLGFMKHQKRDRDKREWCEINNISYIALPYNEQSDWENLIQQ